MLNIFFISLLTFKTVSLNDGEGEADVRNDELDIVTLMVYTIGCGKIFKRTCIKC